MAKEFSHHSYMDENLGLYTTEKLLGCSVQNSPHSNITRWLKSCYITAFGLMSLKTNIGFWLDCAELRCTDCLLLKFFMQHYNRQVVTSQHLGHCLGKEVMVTGQIM
jgi:hypothetical protein